MRGRGVGYLFEIFQAKDEEFGLEQYTDRVCVIFESGNPSGESGEFETVFSESLSDWCGFDPEVTAQKSDNVEDFNSSGQEKYVYTVTGSGEAEITGFTDTVTVLLESGDPGGDLGDFAEHIKLALSRWYDGANIIRIE